MEASDQRNNPEGHLTRYPKLLSAQTLASISPAWLLVVRGATLIRKSQATIVKITAFYFKQVKTKKRMRHKQMDKNKHMQLDKTEAEVNWKSD